VVTSEKTRISPRAMATAAFWRSSCRRALDPEERHARRELAHDVVGTVGRAVGRDDDLEPLGRVVAATHSSSFR
jgi:hypothetical protein